MTRLPSKHKLIRPCIVPVEETNSKITFVQLLINADLSLCDLGVVPDVPRVLQRICGHQDKETHPIVHDEPQQIQSLPVSHSLS